MTTNRILTTLVQIILAGVTIPLLVLAIKDFKADLKKRIVQLSTNCDTPDSGGPARNVRFTHYVRLRGIARIFLKFTACRLDSQIL
jgi:hypothetical protein